MKLSYFALTAFISFIAGNAHSLWVNGANQLTTSSHMIVFIIFILTGIAIGVLSSVVFIETLQNQDKE
tara:strand:+ start:923 stop:1126 length:204 start_codon:yes stop_codon:yes gene_type:complete